MAFSRHNIEKHRLIELVRNNPILWDCRLPHYKRSDKRKAVKWNELGRVFRVNGERVQRTFTSLREIFRRELNHEKLLGTRFKSKWEYYEAMAFLKEVIRERKSRERAKSASLPQPNSSSGIDEYQYFAPNDPNNPNNQQQQQQQQQEQPTPQPTQQQSPQQSQQQQQQQTQQQPLIQLHPDVILNVNATQLQQQLQQLTTNVLQTQLQQQQQEQQKSLPQQHLSPNQPDLLSSIDSGSSSPSIYIKDEPDSQDETISVSTTNNEKACRSIKSPTTATAPTPITTAATTSNCQQVTTTATQAHLLSSSNNNNNVGTTNNNSIYHKTTNSQRSINYNSSHNNNQNHGSKLAKQLQRNGFVVAPAAASAVGNIDADCDIDDIDLDPDDLDDDIDDADDIDDIVAPATAADGRLSAATTVTLRRRRESPREILYTKFGDFLAARLNTLNETVANELMNKILMLIAEK